MNEPDSFFPFKSDTLESPIILNKRDLLALTVPAPQQPEVEPGDGRCWSIVRLRWNAAR